MACYAPLRAMLVQGPEGRRLEFKNVVGGKPLSLPCGRCIGCRLERARQWAVRLMHEAKMHESSIFATLTYSPERLPLHGSLSVKDCQGFLKRLRARIAPTRIRFFLAGEYGEKLERPHYHACIFGWAPPNPVFYKRSGDKPLYTDAVLSAAWGLGFANYGQVEFDSACYVASYATKKITGSAASAHYGLRRPEFCLMSRRPGIGRGWIEEYAPEVYRSDSVVVRGAEARPPRYYDQCAEALGMDLGAVKARREERAQVLEELVWSEGTRRVVAAGLNAPKLAVAEKVARAKLALKRRDMENE